MDAAKKLLVSGNEGMNVICEKVGYADVKYFTKCSIKYTGLKPGEHRKSSAIIYSIAETAKANSLKPYNYFEHLLAEIPKHMDDHDTGFCEDLLPWSDKLPAECRKQTDL